MGSAEPIVVAGNSVLASARPIHEKSTLTMRIVASLITVI